MIVLAECILSLSMEAKQTPIIAAAEMCTEAAGLLRPLKLMLLSIRCNSD